MQMGKINDREYLINLEDVIDIIRESPDEQIYYNNEILRKILFSRMFMSMEQYRGLVYDYGMTLRQKDICGRKLFVRMVLLIGYGC